MPLDRPQGAGEAGVATVLMEVEVQGLRNLHVLSSCAMALTKKLGGILILLRVMPILLANYRARWIIGNHINSLIHRIKRSRNSCRNYILN